MQCYKLYTQLKINTNINFYLNLTNLQNLQPGQFYTERLYTVY